MKNVPVLKFIFFYNLCNPGQRFGQPGSRHRAIINQIIGRQAGNCAKSAAPAFPQAIAFRVIFGFKNITSLIFAAQLADPGHLIFEAGRNAFDFNDQDGCRIPRIAAVVAVFHRIDNRYRTSFRRAFYPPRWK